MSRNTDFFDKIPRPAIPGRSLRDGNRRRADRDFSAYVDHRHNNDWELAPTRQIPPVSPAAERTAHPDSPDRPRDHRRDSRHLDSDSESSPERSSPLWQTQIICNPAIAQKDITLHFQMTIEDDVQGCLEELARLKRLGWFQEALEYFDLNLKAQLDLPLVTIEYADLLVEQGAHHRLRELLDTKQLQPPRKSKIVSGFSNDVNLYAAHFALLRRVSDVAFSSVLRDELPIEKMRMVAEYIRERVDPDFTPKIKENARVPLDPTEIQIMRRHGQLCSVDWYAKGIPRLELPPQAQSPLYQNLLCEGRIWELCDIISDAPPWILGLLIVPTGENHVWHDEDILERMLQDWSLEEYDPSTELALLSILVNMAYTFEECDFTATAGKKSRIAGIALQNADVRAALIQKNSPELMRSRPYLQWCLAKERLERHWNSPPRHEDFLFNKSLGLDPWDLPVSIEMKWEGLDWPPVNPQFPPNDVLDGILRVSRENGDHRTEEDCLTEIICRTDSPGPLLDQLGDLQLSCGNNVGHLITCLSKYLLVTDQPSAEKLVQELKKANALLCGPPQKDLRLHLRLAESMVNSALHLLLRGHTKELDQWQDISHDISDAMDSQSSRKPKNRLHYMYEGSRLYYGSDDSEEGGTGDSHRYDDAKSDTVVQQNREIKRLERELERRKASARFETDFDAPTWSERYEDSTAPPAERVPTRRPYYRERSLEPSRHLRRNPERNHTRLRFRDRAELDKGEGEEYLEIPDDIVEEIDKGPSRRGRVRLDPESYRDPPTRGLIADSKTRTRRPGSFNRQRSGDAGDQEKKTTIADSEVTAGSSKVYRQGPQYETESETDLEIGRSALPEDTNIGRRVEVETGDDSGKD